MSKSVLIVDDGPLGHLFKRYLESQGYGTEDIVSDLDDLKTKLTEHEYSVVLICAEFGLSQGEFSKNWDITNEVIGTAGNNSPFIFYSYFNKIDLLIEAEKYCPELCQDDYKDLWELLQIPTSLQNITETIEQLLANYETRIEKRKQLYRIIAERRAEQQDRNQRHINNNLQAAERILNGALRSGDYNLLDRTIEEKAIKYYIQLIKYHPIKESEEIEQAKRTIYEAKNEYESDPEKRNNEWVAYLKKIKKILIIDDQISMWEPVWKFILGDSKVEIVENGDKGLEKIKNGEEYDCVLLDISLGEGKQNGIEVLQRIKHEQFDLPVIMMTAFDHSELTKLCLQYGADNYFVKELKDERISIDYYKYIRDLIKHIPILSAPERRTWREFSKHEALLNAIDKKWETDIGVLFRKAYYLLTMDDEHFLPGKLLIPEWRRSIDNQSTKYEGAVCNLIAAFDHILIAIYRLNNTDEEFEEAKYEIMKLKNNGEAPKLKERAKRALTIGNYSLDKLNDKADCRHAFKITSKPLTKGKAVETFEEFLNFIEKIKESYFHEVDFLSDQQNYFVAQKDDISRYQVVQMRDSHEVRSKASAEYLLKGHEDYLKNRHQEKDVHFNNKKILFIDDEGRNGAWYKSLKKILNERDCQIDIEVDYGKNKAMLDNYDLVLLDLIFEGGQPKGFDYLRDIREDHLSIPVVMLTANNKSVSARKCLLTGADDYFVKEPLQSPHDYYLSFVNIIRKYLVDDIESLRRTWWKLITQTEQFGFGLNALEKNNWNNLRQYKPYSKLNNQAIIKTIRQLAFYPFFEGYFFYILYRYQNSIDLSRAKRLLCANKYIENDVLICFGQIVEYLISELAQIQGKDRYSPAGHLINILHFPLEKQYIFRYLWDLRTRAKLNERMTDINIEEIFNKLINCMKTFQFIGADSKDISYDDNKYLQDICKTRNFVFGETKYKKNDTLAYITLEEADGLKLCDAMTYQARTLEQNKKYEFKIIGYDTDKQTIIVIEKTYPLSTNPSMYIYNDIIEVEVEKLMSEGILVKDKKDICGFVPNSEMGNEPLSVGSIIRTKIINKDVSTTGKLRLSKRQCDPPQLSIDSIYEGTVKLLPLEGRTLFLVNDLNGVRGQTGSIDVYTNEDELLLKEKLVDGRQIKVRITDIYFNRRANKWYIKCLVVD